MIDYFEKRRKLASTTMQCRHVVLAKVLLHLIAAVDDLVRSLLAERIPEAPRVRLAQRISLR